MPAPSSASTEPARLASLDGLRGLAILFVVLFHALFFGVPLPGAVPLDGAALYPRLATLGWCGVDVFFVLSGFLITGILLRSKGAPHYFRNFYARRSLRIFPLYYVVVVLLLFVLDRPPADAATKASYLLYYQNWRYALVGEVPFDPARLVTWSLAIEEQFYLLWPAVVWLVGRRTLVVVCLVAIVGAMALRLALLAGGLHTTYFLTPCRLDTLAAGALFAVVGCPGPRLGTAAALAGAIGLWTTAAWAGSPFPETPSVQRFGLPSALLLAVGLLSLALAGGRFARLCTWRPLRSLGQFSYCIYLVHYLVIDGLARASYFAMPAAWQQWLLASLTPVPLVLLFTLACLTVSWAIGFASWHLFEKWFLALKRHFPSAGA